MTSLKNILPARFSRRAPGCEDSDFVDGSSFPSPCHDFRAVLAVKGSRAPHLKNGAPLTAPSRSEPAPLWKECRVGKGFHCLLPCLAICSRDGPRRHVVLPVPPPLRFSIFIAPLPRQSSTLEQQIFPHKRHQISAASVLLPWPVAELLGRGSAESCAADRHPRTTVEVGDVRSR